MDLFSTFSAWHVWMLLGIALVLGEALIPGYVILWFGLGALITAIPAWLGMPVGIQLIVFTAASFALFAASRTILHEFLFCPGETAALGTDALIGRVGVVEELLPTAGGWRGIVKVGGESWSAVARHDTPGYPVEASAGDEVEVVRIEGATLVVRQMRHDRS